MRGQNTSMLVRIGAEATPTRAGGWMARGYVNGARDPIEVRSDFKLKEGETVRVRPDGDCWRTLPPGASL